MREKAFFLAATLLLLSSIGCNRGGEEFVGRWSTVKNGGAEDWAINSNGTAVQWVESEGEASSFNHSWSVKNGSLQLYRGGGFWGGTLRFVALPPSEDTLILQSGDVNYADLEIRLRRATPFPASTAEERYALWEKESEMRELERRRLEILRQSQDLKRSLERTDRILKGIRQ